MIFKLIKLVGRNKSVSIYINDINNPSSRNDTSQNTTNVPIVAKSIKFTRSNNASIGFARIYIYDDKNQLIKRNLSVKFSPQPEKQQVKFAESNLIIYDDGLDNNSDMSINIGKSPPGSSIEVILDKPTVISKIILLNYSENGVLANLINNTTVSLLGDSGNFLKSYTINQTSPTNTYEIKTNY